MPGPRWLGEERGWLPLCPVCIFHAECAKRNPDLVAELRATTPNPEEQ